MKWDNGISEARLVADDGEIIAVVALNYTTGAYRVQSTGKNYVTMDQAKAAAERAARELPQ